MPFPVLPDPDEDSFLDELEQIPVSSPFGNGCKFLSPSIGGAAVAFDEGKGVLLAVAEIQGCNGGIGQPIAPEGDAAFAGEEVEVGLGQVTLIWTSMWMLSCGGAAPGDHVEGAGPGFLNVSSEEERFGALPYQLARSVWCLRLPYRIATVPQLTSVTFPSWTGLLSVAMVVQSLGTVAWMLAQRFC